MATKVTAKEELYCQQYIKTLNKAKAAVLAGYSKKSAKEIGYENFTKPHIQSRIAEIRQDLKDQMGIDDHSVLSELAALSYWNIKDFVTDKNEIKDISKMPKSKLKPVVGIKITTSTTSFEGGTRKESTVDLKMVDKRGAIVDLGRHLGIFEKDNRQKVMKIKVTRNG